MKKLRLYSTSHCTLCEQLLETLMQLPLGHVQLEVLDVAEDDNLLQRYGERIPVLTLDGVEYQGGVDARELAEFLS